MCLSFFKSNNLTSIATEMKIANYVKIYLSTQFNKLSESLNLKSEITNVISETAQSSPMKCHSNKNINFVLEKILSSSMFCFVSSTFQKTRNY